LKNMLLNFWNVKWWLYFFILGILEFNDFQNETRAARARSVSKVVALFKQLNVDVVTKWRTAHNLLLESDEWKMDTELRKLPTLDILLAFEDYSRVREREYEEQMRRSQVEKTRTERKAREAFKVRRLILFCFILQRRLGTVFIGSCRWARSVQYYQSTHKVERGLSSVPRW
jgi:hypothetical protein